MSPRFLTFPALATPTFAAPILAALAACGPVDPEMVQRRCEERARQAQGPSGRVTVGVNSESGPYVSGEIGITADAIAGRDPIEVYEECVFARTGALPTRPPVLN